MLSGVCKTIKPNFGHLPKIETYATPCKGNGNKYLRLYQTQPPGITYPWLFTNRENAKAAVHSLTVVQNKNGKQFIYLLVTRRPPLGGKLSIELPAGLWEDKDNKETALAAANREVKEETGYKVKSSKLLSSNPFATSPGMTTERKIFALTKVKGKPGNKQFDSSEGAVIVDKMLVPVSTFRKYRQFTDWLNKMNREGYIVGMDVIAARGLLPPRLSHLA